MSRVLASFGIGQHAEMLLLAIPGFVRYAQAHGYAVVIPHAESFSADVRARPPAWWKVPLIENLLAVGNEAVLWIDADVVIKRFDRDIADDCGDQPLHLAVHHTADGAVPNTGVMYVRKSFLPTVRTLWEKEPLPRSDGWWEQSAFIAALGGDPGATPVSVPDGPLWGQLGYEWNPHVRDARGLPKDSRFVHTTCCGDRVEFMRRVIDDEA